MTACMRSYSLLEVCGDGVQRLFYRAAGDDGSEQDGVAGDFEPVALRAEFHDSGPDTAVFLFARFEQLHVRLAVDPHGGVLGVAKQVVEPHSVVPANLHARLSIDHDVEVLVDADLRSPMMAAACERSPSLSPRPGRLH